MAVYMSAARQRRRTIAIAVATLVLGLIAGLLIGRTTASGIDDDLSASRSRGRSLAAALRALPIEYEQAYSDTGENQAGIEDATQRVANQADSAVANAPWLSATERTRVTEAVAAVVDTASRRAPPTDFEEAAEEAATTAEDVFGAS